MPGKLITPSFLRFFFFFVLFRTYRFLGNRSSPAWFTRAVRELEHLRTPFAQGRSIGAPHLSRPSHKMGCVVLRYYLKIVPTSPILLGWAGSALAKSFDMTQKWKCVFFFLSVLYCAEHIVSFCIVSFIYLKGTLARAHHMREGWGRISSWWDYLNRNSND